jgi:hypothetical protein
MNGTLKKALIAIIVAGFLAWAGWITNTSLQAAIDYYKICDMANDITEIKQDIKDIRHYIFNESN